MANMEKTNRRLYLVSRRQLKSRFDGLSKLEKQYVKTQQEIWVLEHQQDDFWRHAPRDTNGAVAWSLLDDSELDCFEWITFRLDKLRNKRYRLEEQGINPDKVFLIYNQVNCNSQCY